MNEHLVIAGGGQAATQTAQSARQLGFGGQITLVAEEAHLPYQRPPLSKSYLSGQLERDRLALKPEQFYATREIDLRLGTRAESFDPASRRVRLSDGESLEYSDLLLATGSAPRRISAPGVDLPGIHYFRSIDDVESIRSSFESGKHLLIIGAGYIGLEVAAVATRAGLSVTIVEAEARVMARSVSADVARFYTDYHRQAGVDFRFESRLTSFYGDTVVRGAETDRGEKLEADIVIVAIGILPNAGIAEAAGLAIDNGIAVDASTRSSAPCVFAAGDCTSHPHPWAGRRIRLESVQNAIEQGKVAAATICGEEAVFDAVPWFWSDQYDLKLQIAGLSQGFDATVMRGNPDDGSFSVYYLEGGRVIAVDSINDPKSFIAARQCLPGKPRWPAEAIADTSCDLTALAEAP